MRPFARLLLIALFPMSIGATTIRVPLDFTDIQTAIDASSSGDTVLVAPKTYRVNLDFSGKNIVLLSEAGPELTVLEHDIYNQSTVLFNNGEGPSATLTGFTLLGGTSHASAVKIDGASPTIRGNYLKYHHSITGPAQLYVRSSGGPTIDHNVFLNDDNVRMAMWIWTSNPVSITNNTIYGGGDRGIYISTGPVTVRNNIVVGFDIGIVFDGIGAEDYNDSWGNTDNYVGITPHPNSISLDPQFIDTSSGNVQLRPTSPCINAGNPIPTYNDPDGTIGDMGALYFDTRIPSAYNLGIIGEDIGHVLNHDPVFHWSFYGIEQEAFQVEVGTDNDWTSAEMWSYVSSLSTDTSITYVGIPLQDSMTYYYRLRVSDSASLGHWVESVFRMNSPSFTPQTHWPVGEQLVCIKYVQLFADNPNEPEGDSLFFDYELYSDAGLTNLVTSISNIPEQPDTTGSGYISELNIGQEYFWRCRSFDKYQYSDWSPVASFTVRSPIQHQVPSVYGTIQEGINAAQQGDTVMVADGIYSGDGNRDLLFHGKNIALKSQNGPDATSIIVGGSESDLHRGISFENGEDSSSVVDGFTIGYGYVDQAAVYVQYYNGVTMKNCVVTESSYFGLYSGWGGFVRIDSCRFENNSGTGAYLVPEAEVTNSLFYRNGGDGLTIDGWNLTSISNCTFVSNNENGFLIMGEPPLKSTQASAEDSNYIFNCVAAYNGNCGLGQYFWSRPVAVSCNNSYGNYGWDDYCISGATVGEQGNISQHPLFCDTTTVDFSLSSSSPCAPANNSCSVQMGSFDVGCAGCCVHRGDINHSGGTTPVDISDITAFVDYLFGGGPAPICEEEGDVDGSGQIDITDLTVMVDFIFNAGNPPPPCP